MANWMDFDLVRILNQQLRGKDVDISEIGRHLNRDWVELEGRCSDCAFSVKWLSTTNPRPTSRARIDCANPKWHNGYLSLVDDSYFCSFFERSKGAHHSCDGCFRKSYYYIDLWINDHGCCVRECTDGSPIACNLYDPDGPEYIEIEEDDDDW